MIDKFCIKIKECEYYQFSLDKILYLTSIYFKNPIDSPTLFQEMNKINYVKYNDINNPDITDISLTESATHLLESIFLNSEFSDAPVQDRFCNLAKKLQEIYPEGKKPGTCYYWRDSLATIIRKLKTVVKKYGDCFTDEQAINATKKYVESFNGNYQYMQLLKYFICKNVIKGGELEETSQLLSYIENEGQEDSVESGLNWDLDLK